MKTMEMPELPAASQVSGQGRRSVIERIKAWKQGHQDLCYYASLAWKVPAVLGIVAYQLGKLAMPHVRTVWGHVQEMYYTDRGFLFGMPALVAVVVAFIGIDRYCSGMTAAEPIWVLDWWILKWVA